MKFKALIVLLTLFISGLAIAAASSSPIDMLKTVSDKMIADLKKSRPDLKKNPEVVYGIVDKVLLPEIDVDSMCRAVLGRDQNGGDVWSKATLEQRSQFTKEFKTLVMRTYASALASYNDQTVKFMPIRGGYQGQSRVQVDSMILQHDGPSIPVSYRLELQNNNWKVYDFSVDGVSIVDSFRSQFSQDLQQNGLTPLIQKLAQHNKNTSND